MFIKDGTVAEELLNAIREPGRDDLPSHEVLGRRWKKLGGQKLPSQTLWVPVVAAFRRQATKRIILSDQLRELLNAQNLQQLKELIERLGGVKVQVRRDKYSPRMRTKFSPVDPQSGKPLTWTSAFKDAFPLLIELRDFYALRRSNECGSFLE